ncbi:MAG TPA: matrixin family metalloprotease [Candidatus Limnocylindrales bacterium]|nr:matrixin family metalloprotease [Candidatus Limnocylindrales bacterium]
MKNTLIFVKPMLLVMFALAALLTGAGEAHGRMVKMSLEDLTNEADSIVVGTIISTNSHWNTDRTGIYTTARVAVEEELKTDTTQAMVTIIVPGGEVGEITQWVSDAPVFEPGERAVLFLTKMPRARLPGGRLGPTTFEVYGRFQGKIEIDEEEAGGVPTNELEKQINNIIENGSTDDSAVAVENQQMFVTNTDFVYNGMRWPGASPSVPFFVNASPDRIRQIEAAAETWNGAGANFSFRFAGTHNRSGRSFFNNVNEIMWHPIDSHNVVAYASVWFSNGTILENDMVFNSRFGWSTDHFTFGGHDVQTVALHEFGHWLSLGHSSVFNSIMYWQIKAMQTRLDPVDIAGIRHIYGTASGAGNNLLPGPCIIATPVQPLGPATGFTNSPLTFSTDGSHCSNGHIVEYRFNWGDGTLSDWSGLPSVSKTWTSEGGFEISAQARCAINHAVESSWSPVWLVTITVSGQESGQDLPPQDPIPVPDPEPLPVPTPAQNPTPVPTEFSLTITTIGQGTTNPPPGVYWHASGTETSLSATPAPGWRFDQWVINRIYGTAINTTLRIDSNIVAIAYFSEILNGDVNGDGTITVTDIALVMRHTLGLATLNEDQMIFVDVNRDRVVDVRDIALLMRYALGIITSFPE